jgi:hypothetical protein
MCFRLMSSAFNLTIDLQVPVPLRLPHNPSPTRQAASQVDSGRNPGENVSVIPVVSLIHLHFVSLAELQHRPSPNRLQLLPPSVKPDVTYQHGGPVI